MQKKERPERETLGRRLVATMSPRAWNDTCDYTAPPLIRGADLDHQHARRRSDRESNDRVSSGVRVLEVEPKS